MRSSRKTLVAALASLLLVPQLAAADEVEEQLRQMQERMSQLEDQLTATNDQLEHANKRVTQQENLIERAGLEDERGSASGISDFIQQTEFNLSVATSYFWNFNDPSAPQSGAFNSNSGTFGANPFHPNHNSYQVDEVWFSMMKAATPESRAGFGVDVVFGQTADALNGFGAGSAGSGSGDDPNVYQAYISYLAPIGEGIHVHAGRWETLTGAEVARASENFNITRGLLYSTLQPINHTGVLLSGKYDSGFEWALGGANDSGFGNPGISTLNNDNDNDKIVIGRIGYSTDTLGVTVNGLYGGNTPYGGAFRDGDGYGLVDVVLNWDPTDDFSGWINFDYAWIDNPANGIVGDDPEAFGIGAAGRMALDDRTGFSIRAEYIHTEDAFILGPAGFAAAGLGDEDIWSVTGTLDRALTDHLTLKAEVRYEEAQKDNGFPFGDPFYLDDQPSILDTTDSQVLLGAQLVYEF